MSDNIWTEEVIDGTPVLVCPDSWLDILRALAEAEGLSPLELVRRRVELAHDSALLRREMRHLRRLLIERVAKPGSAWLDAAEVAQLLRMTVRAVYVDMQRRPSGELARACTRVGRRLRFSREGIDAMLRQSLRPGTRSVLIRPSPVPSARKETGR